MGVGLQVVSRAPIPVGGGVFPRAAGVGVPTNGRCVALRSAVLALLTVTSDIEFGMYMLKFAPLQNQAWYGAAFAGAGWEPCVLAQRVAFGRCVMVCRGRQAWELGLVPFWILDAFFVLVPLIERARQVSMAHCDATTATARILRFQRWHNTGTMGGWAA